MAVISYFPTADNLKKISKLGDVITIKSLRAYSTGTYYSSYYSENNLLSTTSYMFSSLSGNITAVYLPECLTVGTATFKQFSYLTSVSFPKCTSIGTDAFYRCSSLSIINLPNCTSIGISAFYSCSSLQTINIPKCVSMSTGAFINCSQLSVISCPSCTYIGADCFSLSTPYSQNAEKTVYLPECTSMGNNVFTNNNIVDLYIPKIETIPYGAFSSCYIKFSSNDVYFSNCTLISNFAFANGVITTDIDGGLNLHFPNCTTVGSRAFEHNLGAQFMYFNECTSVGESAFCSNFHLTVARFPKLSIILAQTFQNTQLNEADFPLCTQISYAAFASTNVHSTSFPLCTTIYGSISSSMATFRTTLLSSISFPQLSLLATGYIFAGCTKLTSIYIMASSVCKLSTASAFKYTPITDSTYTGTFGSIYVPSSLLASYKAATNWKTISARIVGI